MATSLGVKLGVVLETLHSGLEWIMLITRRFYSALVLSILAVAAGQASLWSTSAGAQAPLPRALESAGSDSHAPAGQEAIRPQGEPIKLFNGKDLDGFYTYLEDTGHQDPRQVFTVKDDMIHISGDGYGGLITEQEYRDYHLIIEFKWGERTWGGRQDRARDSGVLVHCYGSDGGFGGRWMASVEAQIIEGGVGDILVLSGEDSQTGQTLPVSLTAEISTDRDGEKVWQKGGERVTLSRGRINWWGRDEDWADKIGFRGKRDVESPFGQWTRMEIICEGDHLLYKVNGVTVNEAFDVQPSQGKILLQTELAEMFVRRYELWPLGKAPEFKANSGSASAAN